MIVGELSKYTGGAQEGRILVRGSGVWNFQLLPYSFYSYEQCVKLIELKVCLLFSNIIRTILVVVRLLPITSNHSLAKLRVPVLSGL